MIFIYVTKGHRVYHLHINGFCIWRMFSDLANACERRRREADEWEIVQWGPNKGLSPWSCG